MKKQMISLLLACVTLLAGCNSGASSSATESAVSSSSEASSSLTESSSAASSEQSSEAQITPATPEEMSALGFDPLPDTTKLSGTQDEIAAKIKAMYEGTGEYASLPTAEMETSMGTIKIRLFPKEAPKTVENFMTHARNGYYDGVTFHRVLEDFMVQGGDPQGTGAGGDSIWGGTFEDEFSDYLYNFRGALSMANAGPNTNGSQFFIVQNPQPITGAMKDQMTDAMFSNRLEQMLNIGRGWLQAALAKGVAQDDLDKVAAAYGEQMNALSAEEAYKAFTEQIAPAMEIYEKVGGTPYLDGKHTVFGYVYEGMDVVDAMVKVEKLPDPSGNEASQPKEPIKIIKITIKLTIKE